MEWRFRSVMGGLRHLNMGFVGVARVEEYLRFMLFLEPFLHD